MLSKWRGKWYLFAEIVYFASFLMLFEMAKKKGVFCVKAHDINVFKHILCLKKFFCGKKGEQKGIKKRYFSCQTGKIVKRRRKWHQKIGFAPKKPAKRFKKIFRTENESVKMAKKMVSFLRILILGEKKGCKSGKWRKKWYHFKVLG